ncbi:MAG: hypothetical protein ACP5RD_00635 [bacterium]
MNKKNKIKGFSILELALSIAIIALIVIFIIGMYSMFFTANTKLNDVSVATFIGQSWLNKIASYASSENDSQWITTRLNPTATALKKRVSYGLYSAQFVGGKSFTVYIWTNPIYGNPNADLYAVNVTVYWMESKNQSRNRLIRGYGKNYLDFRKVVTVPKNF